ncbi:MAG: ATPase, T2SS/T4P/T4SS family [Methylotenera sp.]|nr:ATPase, T2SS/T4P/T4SS family [Methylotenera sp.]
MALTSEQLLDAALKVDMIQRDTLTQLRNEARRRQIDVLLLVQAHYRLPKNAFYRAAAELRGLPFLEMEQLTPDLNALKKLPQALIRRKNILPLFVEGEDGVLFLVTADPDDRTGIDTSKRLLNQAVQLALSEPRLITKAIDRAYQLMQQASIDLDSAVQQSVDLVSLLDTIFREAYFRRSSDIHIMQDEQGLRVRLRVDGKLQEYIPDTLTNHDVANGLISRIKVLADLDISEQREPQDGGLSYRLDSPVDAEFNVRVATAPTRIGERVTMRILGQDAKDLSLAKIGMTEGDLILFQEAIRKPFGMILLTGPTGSGKSTTLFAALREISTPDINILTVENPIEYVIEGVSQVQTGAKVTFASALRSFLRHDPDVLMVGEIRDEETADVALKASMTGHLVFSTLHTNTAAGSITRLVDIGCEPFLIGATMNAIIAQRLVRKLCMHCRVPYEASNEEKTLMAQPLDKKVTLYRPQGCAICDGTGYRGRMGLFETLWFNEDLSKMVSKGCSEEELESVALPKARLRLMWDDGVAKVMEGHTTLAEVQKVTIKRVINA